MPVIDITTDAESLSSVLTAEFAAPIEKVWRALHDPSQLERFWGRPDWPATVTEWNPAVGGRALFKMTGADGESVYAAWEFLEIDEPRRFEVSESFVDERGVRADDSEASRQVYELTSAAGGTRLTLTSHFPSAEALEAHLAMGADEFLRATFAHLDRVLGEPEA